MGREYQYQNWLRGAIAAGLVLLALVSLLLSHGQVIAQESTTLRCRLESSTVGVDSNVTLFIEIVNVADLYGYEFTLKFNGSRIHFVDADPGKAGVNLQVGDFLSPDFVVVNDVNNGAGQANLALTQLSPSQAVGGTGELARAALIGVASGMVSFSFADVILSNPIGVAIPTTLQGCSIEVTGGAATATPTPTTTPTPTPTPTATATPQNGEDTASISGSVFFDTDGNGIRSPDEQQGVYAFVAAYRLGTSQQWADLTEDDGTFAFRNLPPGRYFVDIRVLEDGNYVFTTQSTYNIILTVGGSDTADFGLNFDGRRWIVFMPHMATNTQAAPPTGTGETLRIYLPALAQNGESEPPIQQTPETAFLLASVAAIWRD